MEYMKIFKRREKGKSQDGNGNGDAKLDKVEACPPDDDISCEEQLTTSMGELHSKIKQFRELALAGDISLPVKTAFKE
jgi:hypothetical protein